MSVMKFKDVLIRSFEPRLNFFVFPFVVLLTVVGLTMFEISGSSIALYETSAGQSKSSAGVLLGDPRPVRSDEWLVRVPWLIGQAQNEFPTVSESGIGSHEVVITGDVPVRGFDLVVKPHHLPLVILGPSKAVAAEWWTLHAVLILGVYYLLLFLIKRIDIAVGVSLLLAMSPSTQWWVGPATFTTVGYGALSATSFMAALETSSPRKRNALVTMSAWLFSCFVCSLYVPWLVTTALVLLPIVASRIIHNGLNLDNQKEQVRLFLRTAFKFSFVVAALIGIFVIRHKTAVGVMNATVYPGARSSESGGGVNFASLFGAPLDYKAWRPVTAFVNGTNQSENSSGIVYLIPCALAFFGLLFSRRIDLRNRDTVQLAASTFAGLLLLAWALLPVPTLLGKFFLLDRVPPVRVLPALAFVSLVALGQYLSLNIEPKTLREWISIFLSVSAFLAVGYFAAHSYQVEGMNGGLRNASIAILFLTCMVFFVFWKFPKIGISGLIIFGIVQFANTNPIQRGIDPVIKNPVALEIQAIRRSIPKNNGWFLVNGDIYVRGTLEASGVPFVSGVSRYPDYEAWRVLDPTLKYEDAWNRYGHIFVSVGEKGADPIISSPQGDVIQIVLDPCDERLQRINVDVLVTQNFELDGCGNLIDSVVWGERTIRFYSVS